MEKKTKDNKMTLITALTHRAIDFDTYVFLLTFIKLPTIHFNKVCIWTEEEWSNFHYYTLKEIISIRNYLYDDMMILEEKSDSDIFI
jgi:hypothetical protein